MKKIISGILLIMCLLSLSGCVDHNDGVCDYKDCKMTIGVIRYDENHEFCLKHAIEEGLK